MAVTTKTRTTAALKEYPEIRLRMGIHSGPVIGSICGLVIALGGAQLLKTMLYRGSPSDPIVALRAE